MLSRRVPPSTLPNEWSKLLESRRRTGATLIDLTEANPTRVGLGGLEDEIAGRVGIGPYEPDARGLRVAREAVSDYYAGRGLKVDPDHVILTASTSEAYAHLFRLLCDPGDEILAPQPSYPLFEPLAMAEGVGLTRYRLVYDRGWKIDLDSVRRAVSPQTRAVIVVQPNHPTGSCLSAEEMAGLEALCEEQKLSVIADEVFGDFPWPDTGTDSSLPTFIGSRRVPTFVLSGLSKVCGMPQMKLSWIIAFGPPRAREQALEGLEWLADLFLSVGTPVQQALPRLLEAQASFRSRTRARITQNLDSLRTFVTTHPGIELLRALGGWVAVLKLPTSRSEEDWALELLHRDVVAHPGHFYDFEDEPYLVLSLIVRPESLELALQRIGQAFEA